MKGLVTLAAVAAAFALPSAASAQSIRLDAPDLDCMTLSGAARMVDSGALRVCQSEYGVTGAYLGGHLARPLLEATAALQLTFADSGEPLYMSDLAELAPAVAGTPFTGVSRYELGTGETPDVQV